MAKKKQENTKTYTATAKVLGRTFAGKGVTALEAIKSINTGAVAGKVVLGVSNGTVTKERILTMVQAKRLWMSSGLMREIALKNISLLFDGV